MAPDWPGTERVRNCYQLGPHSHWRENVLSRHKIRRLGSADLLRQELPRWPMLNLPEPPRSTRFPLRQIVPQLQKCYWDHPLWFRLQGRLRILLRRVRGVRRSRGVRWVRGVPPPLGRLSRAHATCLRRPRQWPSDSQRPNLRREQRHSRQMRDLCAGVCRNAILCRHRHNHRQMPAASRNSGQACLSCGTWVSTKTSRPICQDRLAVIQASSPSSLHLWRQMVLSCPCRRWSPKCWTTSQACSQPPCRYCLRRRYSQTLPHGSQSPLVGRPGTGLSCRTPLAVSSALRLLGYVSRILPTLQTVTVQLSRRRSITRRYQQGAQWLQGQEA